jgi:hypothetical protein
MKAWPTWLTVAAVIVTAAVVIDVGSQLEGGAGGIADTASKAVQVGIWATAITAAVTIGEWIIALAPVGL